jgi:hypothetical protein
MEKINKKFPCVLIQLDSANPLVLQRQIEKLLRRCAFKLDCVVDIYETNYTPVSDIYQPWVVKFNSKEEWLKQQVKIHSKILTTIILMVLECDKDGFTTNKDDDAMTVFQHIHVIDQTKEGILILPNESSESIASKNESETTLKTICLLCVFDLKSQYSKAPE